MNTDQTFQIREKLLELETRLTEVQPNISTLLRDIHRELKADPDTVTLLSEEECSVLVRGLKKQTMTEIAASAIKKAPKKSQKKMQVGIDL